MSFDLAVWSSKTVPTHAEGLETYRLLCNDMCGGGPEEPGIKELYEELTRRYPEVDTVPEDELDDCPWSVELSRSGHHLIMCVQWPRSNEVRAFVLELARKHGVVLFDPQKSKVLWPEQPPKSGLFGWLKR